jgi:hypothetical protein
MPALRGNPKKIEKMKARTGGGIFEKINMRRERKERKDCNTRWHAQAVAAVSSRSWIVACGL